MCKKVKAKKAWGIVGPWGLYCTFMDTRKEMMKEYMDTHGFLTWREAVNFDKVKTVRLAIRVE